MSLRYISALRGIAALAGLWLLISPAAAQQTPLQKADSLYRAQDYEKAAAAYRVTTRQHPDFGRMWLQYALSLHLSQQYEEAIDAYKKADNLGVNPPTTRYNLACAYSLLGDSDKAFAWLDQSIEAGFDNVQYMEGDTDLEHVRGDPRFAEYTRRVEQAAAPCEFNPNYRQLDFWVGLWDVLDAQGNQLGVNRISNSLKGCLIIEEWRSAYGIEGKSIKYFDPSINMWRENWVSESGTVTQYTGELRDGAMYFVGESHTADGIETMSRSTISPLPEGKVHHVVEQSYDKGRTWIVLFDGTYVMRPESLSQN